MCGVSERQIRKARQNGLNPYMADHFAVVGLGAHPKDIWGDDWITAESFFAEPLYKRELTVQDIPEQDDLFAVGWWKQVEISA